MNDFLEERKKVLAEKYNKPFPELLRCDYTLKEIIEDNKEFEVLYPHLARHYREIRNILETPLQ